ncbi:MAG: hypothetical protein R6X06_00505 [Gammaproteobacteria bacterium]
MAAWLPIIKVALPYLAPVLQVALPVFTKKKSDKAEPEPELNPVPAPDPVLDQQIAELQEAVKTNSESTKALARAIEEIAQANDRAMKRMQRTLRLALGMSAAALLLVLVVVMVLVRS